MTLTTTPHLNFRGEAAAALAFYRSVFGGDLVAVSYAQAGDVRVAEEADWIIWGQVTSPDGFQVMAFDMTTDRAYDPGTLPFYVSVSAETQQETQRVWDGLADGATPLVPIGPSPFSPWYGMLTDRFGVTWIVAQDQAR